jgi:hypothetical protein
MKYQTEPLVKKIVKKSFSWVFLFIFAMKMAISVAPVLIENMDERSLYSVIMQLEIEHESKRSSEGKWEEVQSLHQFRFSQPALEVLYRGASCFENNPVQSFYPSVPTPPPNA